MNRPISSIEELGALHADMTALRRDIHAHPETAFEETRTAALVARELERAGIETHTGIARTGVVGVLRAGSSTRSIGLRADLDALHIHELNTFDHRSRNDGRMHACGHDGHTTMLLGAARHLAATRRFDGIVHFIFQPAEENEGGGGLMVEEGLFTRFPMESVFGMHNWPGMPVGEFGLRAGPMMAASDRFEITLTGRGAHGALPHHGVDPITCASAVVQALQTVVSRNLDPIDSAVISVTQFHSGDAWNVIPDAAVLRGTARSFRADTRDLLERRIGEIASHVALAHGATATLRYERGYPALVNAERETAFCARVLEDLVGAQHVHQPFEPIMASEDFAFMLQAKPGCYVFLGNGPARPGEAGGCMLHNPHYDFNDAALPLGAAYWARLVETALPAG